VSAPEVFTAENAARYGEFLGARYRDQPIIWLLGGDRNPDSPQRAATWRALAAGVKRGDAGRHLITYHPMDGRHSCLLHVAFRFAVPRLDLPRAIIATVARLCSCV
jgi:hypothetical protein